MLENTLPDIMGVALNSSSWGRGGGRVGAGKHEK
jgi:hypothetical protein